MNAEDDGQAFAEAMRDVTPLRSDERVTSSRRPEPKARRARAERLAVLEESVNGALEALEQLGEESAFCRPGVPKRTFLRLKRGGFHIQDEIDLHGMTAGEAKVALKAFLTDAVDREIGCVRIVHGKGLRSGPAGPVLKKRVQSWLTRWDEVLAFASARLHDGGGGAVYVLLRRR